MGYVNRNTDSRKANAVDTENAITLRRPDESKHHGEIERRVLRLMAEHHYDKALDLVRTIGDSRELVNVKGVCLMRLGMYHEAVRLYRSLVLVPGATWMRADLPTVYKTNFATALLLDGHPGGCLELLFEIQETDNPTVKRLRAAIKAWQRGLPFWQKLTWRLGIEPAGCRVAIEAAPGELDARMILPDTPNQPSPPAPRRDVA